MRRSPDAPRTEPTVSAYSAALRLIAARELSTTQIAERLRRRAYPSDAIEEAIDRLRRSGAVDDRRVALARARTDARIKRHGPTRVLRQLTAIGIDRETAEAVVREVFADQDEAAVLEDALARRLARARRPLTDPAERRRIMAHLVRRGFSLQAISDALRRRRRATASIADHRDEREDE